MNLTRHILISTIASLSVVILALLFQLKKASAPAARSVVLTEKKSAVESGSPTPHLVRQLLRNELLLEEQIEAVRALPSDLSPEEFDSLFQIIKEPAPATVNAARWYTLQNEIMEVLRDSRFHWSQYPVEMAALMADRNVDPVVRDYSAQHLALYLGDRSHEVEQTVIDPVMESYLALLQGEREAFEQVTGTAMMALCDLSSKRPELVEPYRDSLEAIFLSIASQERPATLANQISAIQASGRMGFVSLLPVVRELAKDPSSNPSIQLSSVAALGYFADSADKPFLLELAQSSQRVRFAAAAALKNYSVTTD
ncbi:HEAT repeat domain-containing protein [Roseibacillus persicicus]|uniref:HEAT repeat domain-containing protein n=1 Tax=Roseibacillus persicicus TaxID=454148 RepID=A0A918TBC2_9BACT|nr:HEAT repeat domain-containing protein [Roseibacillus persicicus]GHC40170.1 hypothetical protein GCM10007100_00640 [Roseibacillus persicicus]